MAFGKTAETIAKHFDKGQMISLEGRVEYSKHEDKYYTNVIVERFYFCGGGGEKAKTQSPEPTSKDDLGF